MFTWESCQTTIFFFSFSFFGTVFWVPMFELYCYQSGCDPWSLTNFWSCSIHTIHVFIRQWYILYVKQGLSDRNALLDMRYVQTLHWLQGFRKWTCSFQDSSDIFQMLLWNAGNNLGNLPSIFWMLPLIKCSTHALFLFENTLKSNKKCPFCWQCALILIFLGCYDYFVDLVPEMYFIHVHFPEV